MIRFFRKLRNKLLSESKFGKFLLYALGEIILVVIGILIALQVNNWNVERQNNKEEQFYLRSIKDNLNNDALLLETLTAQISKSLLTLDTISRLDNANKGLTVTNDNFTSSFLGSYNFTPVKTTIDELQSSGKLNLIKSKLIKEKLLSYYSYIENNPSDLNRSLVTYSRENIAPHLMVNYPLNFTSSLNSEGSINEAPTRISIDNKSHFIKNALNYRLYVLNALLAQYQQLQIDIEAMIKLVNQDIRN